MVERRLEKILEDKAYVFTSCFAPINCTAFGPMEESGDYTRSHDDIARSKQQDALCKMEAGVKRHVAQAIARRTGSLMSDEDDEVLLTELEAHVNDLNLTENNYRSKRNGPGSSIEFDAFGSCSISELNVSGDEAWEDIENRESSTKDLVVSANPLVANQVNTTKTPKKVSSSSSSVGHTPESYKQTVRSKFEFYRNRHAFAALSPVNENTSKSDALVVGSVSKANATKGQVLTKKPTLAPLETYQYSDEVKPIVISPASRRNEIARLILKRRQTTPSQSTPRSFLDH